MIALFCFLILVFFPLKGITQILSPSGGETALISQIQRDPNNAALRDRLGEYYSSRGYFEKALQSFQTAVSLDPSDLRGRYDLGLMCEITGKYRQALDAYSQELRWNSYELNFRLGWCYTKLGEYGRALSCFNRMEKMKDSAGVHYAISFAQAGMKHYALAVSELNQARKLDPDFQTGKEYFSGASDFEETRRSWRAAAKGELIQKMALAVATAGLLLLFTFIARFLFHREVLSPEENF